MLARYAYDSTSITTRRNALRCLANALLLNTAARQIYVNLGHEGQACNQLKEGTTEDEFLLGRIIFLTTYGTNLDIEKLVDQHRLAELITFVLKRHAERYVSSEGGTQPADPMNNMALTETLKLLFNVTHFCPQRNGSFSKAVPHILAILMECSLAVTNPMEAPVAQLINALLNLPLDHPENARLLFPEQNKDRHVERLIEILDKSIQTYKDAELEQLVTPLLTVIRRLYEIGPQEAQTCMQRRMLPTEQDREQPVGKGESFSARFLRLSMNITTPQLKESISALLFELSDKDAAAFVQNVGYGFASGFLFQHNVPMPESVLENGSGKDRLKANGKPLNPITGQTLESEPESDANLPEMTQEEKEREAERLFVLFERFVCLPLERRKANNVLDCRKMVSSASGTRWQRRYTRADLRSLTTIRRNR